MFTCRRNYISERAGCRWDYGVEGSTHWLFLRVQKEGGCVTFQYSRGTTVGVGMILRKGGDESLDITIPHPQLQAVGWYFRNRLRLLVTREKEQKTIVGRTLG
jgi:hypothetical protein